MHSQASKPTVEFNKILQKYKQMRLDEKRSSSPSLATKNELKMSSKPHSKKPSQHKRVKSDAPDVPRKNANYLQSNLATKAGAVVFSKKTSQQASGTNLMFNSDKTTPKKQLHAFQIGAQFDASSSKKVINVSIDLIKDMEHSGAVDDSAADVSVGGGHWFVLDNSN